MKRQLLMIITVFLLFFAISKILARQAYAIPWPPYTYCVSQGYDTETVGKERFCVFLDGSKCEMEAFYDGECGQDYVKDMDCSKGAKFPWKECCPGYISKPSMRVGVDGACVEEEGWGVCLPCGNEVCDENENICNCPEDCKGREIGNIITKNIKTPLQQNKSQSLSPSYYIVGGAFIIITAAGIITFIKKKKN